MTEWAVHHWQALRSRSSTLDRVWLLTITIGVLVALLDPGRLAEVLTIAGTALLSTAPYIMVAVALIAGLKATGAEATVAAAFSGRELRMIVLAALFGGLAPFCSCEVIPFIAGLLAMGAPLSAVMAFWLSSPLIDPPTVLITAGALGWEFAIGKAIAAVSIGLLGGLCMMLLTRTGAFINPLRSRETGGCCGCGPAAFEGKPLWAFWRHAPRRQTFFHEARVNTLFLVKWMTLAYMLEALLILYVPAEAIGTVVGGDGFGAIVIGALVGAPAYLNGYAAPALVAGLMEQGMSAGAAMSFLVAGAVSSIPAMAAVWSLVRLPVFAAYAALGLFGAIASGTVFALVLTSL